MASTRTAKRIRIPHLQAAKSGSERITMLTSYDALTAPIFEAAGIDVLLVGDSMGNVVLGFDSTIPVTLQDIERSVEAVSRVTTRPLIVADLPFGTYEADPDTAFENAAALMRAGAHAVKVEGGRPRVDTISKLASNGIPVMAHLGYTPQSEHALGGPRLQGRGTAGERLRQDALAVQEAGAFALVLEMVPGNLAKQVTQNLTIPTIGIGAGPHCDGQVLVWSDMAGMTEWTPSFVHRFAELGEDLRRAAGDYAEAVRNGSFPGAQNTREDTEEAH